MLLTPSGRSPIRCYLGAALIIAAATIIRLEFLSLLGLRAPYITFFPAVIGAALYGGFGPGLLATLLSALAASYFWIEPRYSFAIGDTGDSLSFVVFIVSSIAIAAVTESMHRAQRRASRAETEAVTAIERQRAAEEIHRIAESSETDRRQAERRLRMAHEASNSAAWELDLASNRLIWSRELRKLFGVEEEPSNAAMLELLHRDDRERVLEQVRHAIDAGTDLNIEFRILTRDTGERFMLSRGSPLLNAGGETSGYHGIIVDITANKQRELALVRGERKLRLALESGQFGTWDWNLITDKSEWSDRCRSIFGLAEDAEVDLQVGLRALHPDDREYVEKQLRGAIENHKPYAAEFRVVHADGTIRSIASTGQPHYDESGNPVGVSGIIHDITEQNRGYDAIRMQSTLFEKTHEVILTWSARSGIRHWNDAATSLYGFTRKEAMGRVSHELLNTFHPAGMESIDELVFRNGEWRGELVQTASDGRKIIVESIMSVVWDYEGQPFVLESNHDITARRAVEVERERLLSELRTGEHRLRLALDASNAGSWEWDLETNENVWSDEVWKLYDIDPHSRKACYEAWRDIVHTDDRVQAELAVAEAVRSGSDLNVEFRVCDRDGAERWLLARGRQSQDARGKGRRITGIVMDLTRRKRAEEDLRSVSEQRRLALEAAELGAWDHSLDTGEVFWDDACRKMHGIGKGVPIGNAEARSPVHPEDREAAQKAANDAIAGVNGGAYHQEFRVIWPDSSVHWIASHGQAQFAEEGSKRHAIHLTGVSMDITARKQTELEILELNSRLEQRVRQRTAQLESANKELEAFAYAVSHDLRAPLRGIDGWSLALAEDYSGNLDARGKSYIERVRSETQRMGSLIDDMLQLSRITRAEMQSTAVDFSATACGIAAALTEANAGRQIEFVIEPLLKGPGDPRLLDIALTNLLSNAVKFTKPRTRALIEFGQDRRNGEPVFYVRDNGVGFDPAYADSLFRPFSRLHKSSEFPGTGIGLATVERVIHRHGGQVWAEGRIDQGATFYFTVAEAT